MTLGINLYELMGVISMLYVGNTLKEWKPGEIDLI
jgi:hypothetical protein